MEVDASHIHYLKTISLTHLLTCVLHELANFSSSYLVHSLVLSQLSNLVSVRRRGKKGENTQLTCHLTTFIGTITTQTPDTIYGSIIC